MKKKRPASSHRIHPFCGSVETALPLLALGRSRRKRHQRPRLRPPTFVARVLAADNITSASNISTAFFLPLGTSASANGGTTIDAGAPPPDTAPGLWRAGPPPGSSQREGASFRELVPSGRIN